MGQLWLYWHQLQLRAEQMLYFPFCNSAPALGIAWLLWQPKWLHLWLMHSHDVPCAAVSPHRFPKTHEDFTGSTTIFPFSCTVREFLVFCLFWQVMCSNRYTWKRNDAGPFPLADPSLAQQTWIEWLRMQRGRDGGVEELLSPCIWPCCLWPRHVSPWTPCLCSWSPGLTLTQFSGVTLALYHYCGVESSCEGRWVVSHAVILQAAFLAPLPCCCSASFYWLLLDAQPAIAKAAEQLKESAMSFCTKDKF